MKLGIDISQVAYMGTGVARFTAGLIKSICQYDTDNEWHFFFYSFRKSLPPEIKKLIDESRFEYHEQKLPPTLASFLRNDALTHKINIRLPGKFDWFITSDWTEPSAPCKKATVIHDLAFKRYPETVAGSIRATQEKRLTWVARESTIIFADSESTKSDIVKYLHIPEERLVVNYPGVELNKTFDAVLPPPLQKKQYILTLGKREPRKNLERLIEAYNRIHPDGLDLAIVGDRGWGDDPASNTDSKNIHFLGYISDEKLGLLYSSSLFFIYPSIWEGFGYPVIEAMSCGAPVATSKTSSLGEIAKDTAVLFDPENVDSIAHAMKQLIGDEKLRDQLSEKGRKHASKFTWKRYYEKMMEALV